MNLLSITDLNQNQLEQIFRLADQYCENEKSDLLKDKLTVLIFPKSSVRTIISFKRGVQLMGGDTISFGTDVLERREELRDLVGYLNNWTDLVIVRYPSLDVIRELCKGAEFTVINGMTSENHPCEVITDLYSFSKLRDNYTELKYVFVGPENNVCNSYIVAAKLLRLNLTQVCPVEHKSKLISSAGDTVRFSDDLKESIADADIILTDSLRESLRNEEYYSRFQITSELMATAKPDALLNPCPPFFRDEEIAADLIESDHFVGYRFKRNLLPVQQAIIAYCMGN